MQINVKVQVPVLNNSKTVLQWTIYELKRELNGDGPKTTSRRGTDDSVDGEDYFEFEIRDSEYEENIAKFEVAVEDVTYSDKDGALKESDTWRSVWFKLAVSPDMEMARDNWMSVNMYNKGNYIVVPFGQDAPGISY